MTIRTCILLISEADMPESLSGDGFTVKADDYSILSAAGLRGLVTQVGTRIVVDGWVRLELFEDAAAGACTWAAAASVRHTLSCPALLAPTLHTEVVSVPGAVEGHAVRVEICCAPSPSLLGALGGAPWAWVSADDAVTVALWLMPLAAPEDLQLALYCTPPPISSSSRGTP